MVGKILSKIENALNDHKIISDKNWVEIPVPEYPKNCKQPAPGEEFDFPWLKPVEVNYKVVDSIAIGLFIFWIILGWSWS